MRVVGLPRSFYHIARLSPSAEGLAHLEPGADPGGVVPAGILPPLGQGQDSDLAASGGLGVFAIPTLARPTPQVAPTTVPAGDVSNLPEGCHGGDGLGTGGAGSFDPVTLSRIAIYLGLTPQELVTRLGQGQTLAAIATAQGKTEAGLVEILLAPYKDHLAVAVKYGYLTQAEADVTYATRTQALTYQLNITPYYTPSGVAPGYGGGMMGGRGFGW